MAFQLPANQSAWFGVQCPWVTKLRPAISGHLAGGGPAGLGMGHADSGVGAEGEAQLQKGHPEVGAERAMGVTAGGEPAR